MRKRTKRPTDNQLFKALIAARNAPLGQYQPQVGYLHEDGTVSAYRTESMAWLNFDRAVSTCFGSAARRFRGLHGHDTNGSPIVAILMMVQSNGKTVWKHRVDIPAEV